MSKTIRLAATAALFAAASVTHATLVTWTLQDVIFEDGGTANGSFTLDVPLAINSGAGITESEFNTTAGSIFTTAGNYPRRSFDINASAGTYLDNNVVTDLVRGIPGTERVLELVTPDIANLTDGTVSLLARSSSGTRLISGSGECIGVHAVPGGFECNSVRFISSGSITVMPGVSEVPEPSRQLILGIGLLLLFRKRPR